MSDQNTKAAASNNARSNFGKKGWGVIVYSGVNWYIMGMLSISLINILVPVYAGKLGMAEGTLLSFVSIAGLIAFILASFIGKLVSRFGVRKVNGVALILTAVSVVLLGNANTFAAYCITLTLMRICVAVVQQVGGDMSISNWFPKKKGLAIGWSTIGVSLNSVTAVALITAMMAAFGDLKYALYVIAGAVMIFCIINFIFFKDFPEDCGAYPDNDPNEKRIDTSQIKTGWTIRKALKVKEVWFAAISIGSMAMITQGYMSTFIPNMMMHGFDQPMAITLMSICSIIGAFGSYLLGWVDQKYGVKKSCILFSSLVLIGIICYFIPVKGFIWGFLIIIGFCIGASSNYSVSVIAQLFGRAGSLKIFPLMFALVECIAILCSVIAGQSLNLTGSYNLAWIIFGGLMVLSIILMALCDMTPRKDPLELEQTNN